MLLVYNPVDEELRVTHVAKEYLLAPKNVTKLDDVVAKHAVKSCGMWGVVILKGESKDAIESQIQEADKTCREKTRTWAEEEYSEFFKANKIKLDAGIRVEMPDLVAEAKNWLQKNGFLNQ